MKKQQVCRHVKNRSHMHNTALVRLQLTSAAWRMCAPQRYPITAAAALLTAATIAGTWERQHRCAKAWQEHACRCIARPCNKEWLHALQHAADLAKPT
jgi:hypothetical protein